MDSTSFCNARKSPAIAASVHSISGVMDLGLSLGDRVWGVADGRSGICSFSGTRPHESINVWNLARKSFAITCGPIVARVGVAI
jgi:hypothetical protein